MFFTKNPNVKKVFVFLFSLGGGAGWGRGLEFNFFY